MPTQPGYAAKRAAASLVWQKGLKKAAAKRAKLDKLRHKRVTLQQRRRSRWRPPRGLIRTHPACVRVLGRRMAAGARAGSPAGAARRLITYDRAPSPCAAQLLSNLEKSPVCKTTGNRSVERGLTIHSQPLSTEKTGLAVHSQTPLDRALSTNSVEEKHVDKPTDYTEHRNTIKYLIFWLGSSTEPALSSSVERGESLISIISQRCHL